LFVLSFGPGSKGFVASNAASNIAAKVGSATLTEQDFRFAFVAANGPSYAPAVAKAQHIKESIMDKLIEREILATEAERLGFLVSQKEVEDMIADGRMMVLGYPRRVDNYVFKDGKFDYERFKMICQNQLGVSVLRFIEIERRELLADKLRETMKVGVRVSPQEVKDEFEERGLQVNLEFVKFSSRKFEADEEPAQADIEAWAKDHDADLKKLFEERKQLLYTKVDKQVRVRHVLVELAKDATPETTAKAKAQIDAAKKQIDGGAAFAKVASEASTSESNKRRHGEMGWKKKGFTGFGDALDKLVFAAEKNKIIGPERGERGFEIVLVEDVREGDVPYEAAKLELAEQELLRDRAKQKAKAEAQAALDKIKKGEKLETLFPPPKDDKNDRSPEAQMAKMMAGQMDQPALKETGLISRRGELIQDIGVSKELAAKAFSLPVGEVSGPYEVGGSYVIVRVKEHKDPDMKEFDKRKTELEHEAARAKWFGAIDSFAKNRCVELRDGGRIRVNEEIVSYDGIPSAAQAQHDKKLAVFGKEAGYTPCSSRAAF
jgi:peptidyl-prolyl cis-trans isomerase D